MTPTKQPQFNSEMKPIKALLGDAIGPLNVPDYQRSYSWERNEYEAFWEDITGFAWNPQHTEHTYFLGAIILVSEAELEILDGQQRIATLTIMLSSLAHFFEKVDNRKLHRITTRHIKDEDAFGPDVHYLTMSGLDRDFFKSYVQQYYDEKPTTQSHRNIMDCRNYFDQQLQKLLDERGKTEAESMAQQLLDSLRNNVYALVLVTSEFDDAADVFEKLNDRGIQLAAVDLVRMLLLSRCQPSERDEVIRTWQDILTLDEHGNASDLLRYYWITLQGDPTSNRLYRVIKPKISGNNNPHKDGITYKPLVFTKELSRAADIYRDIYAATEGEDVYTNIASYVVHLNAKPLIPLLIKVNSFERDRDRIARAAFTMYVRNRLIGGLSSTDFENVIYSITKNINPKNIDYHLSAVVGNTRNDADFIREFETASIKVQKQMYHILREIEKFLRDDPNSEVKPPSKVHVEHIYPRSPEEGHIWDDHDDWIHRIGNQTLLLGSRNSRAQNKPFQDKRRFYEESNLELNKKLAGHKEWTTEHIEKRQVDLAEIAAKVWPLEKIGSSD